MAVLDGHRPRLAGRCLQQERDIERALGLDRARRRQREAIVGVIGDMVRRPRPAAGLGEAVTRTSSNRIAPIESSFSNWSTARTAPGGTRTLASSTRQALLSAHDRKIVAPFVTGQRPCRVRRGRRTTAPAPPAPRRPAQPDGDRNIERLERLDRDRQPGHAGETCARVSSTRRGRVKPGKTRFASLLGRPASRGRIAQLEIAVDDRFVLSGRLRPGSARPSSPSTSSVPVAPISPTDMIASLVPGGTGIRLATRVQRSRTECGPGPE